MSHKEAGMDTTATQDSRYERIQCVACGQWFQDIDFGCAAHVNFCHAVRKSERPEPRRDERRCPMCGGFWNVGMHGRCQ
jgi:hypothetical protein